MSLLTCKIYLKLIIALTLILFCLDFAASNDIAVGDGVTEGTPESSSSADVPIVLYEGYWLDYDPEMDMSKAVPGSKKVTGKQRGVPRQQAESIKICRAKGSDGSIRVGKILGENCIFAQEDFEVEMQDDFEVLFSNEPIDQVELDWTPVQMVTNSSKLPSEPVAGGYKKPDLKSYLICRIKTTHMVPNYCPIGDAACCEGNRKMRNSHFYAPSLEQTLIGFYDTESGICYAAWGFCRHSSSPADGFEILSKAKSQLTSSPVPLWQFPLFISKPQKSIYYEPILSFYNEDSQFLNNMSSTFEKYAEKMVSGLTASSPELSQTALEMKEIFQTIKDILRISPETSTTPYHYHQIWAQGHEVGVNFNHRIKIHRQRYYTNFGMDEKLSAVCKRFARMLNLDGTIPMEEAKLEVVPTIQVMDELLAKFNAEQSVTISPDSIGLHVIIYASLQRLLCKVAPFYIPSYKATCEETSTEVGKLVLKFSQAYLKTKLADISQKRPDNYDKTEGDFKTLFIDKGYCFSNDNLCQEKKFKFTSDNQERELRADANPGTYTFKRYNGVSDYKNQIVEIYSNFFLQFIDASMRNNKSLDFDNSFADATDSCTLMEPEDSQVDENTVNKCRKTAHICYKETCKDKVICYDETRFDVKWCFNAAAEIFLTHTVEKAGSKRTPGESCNYDLWDRKTTKCGTETDILQTECEAKGCCFDPYFRSGDTDKPIHQCFDKL